MATAPASPDIEEYALRRTQSTGDLDFLPDRAHSGRFRRPDTPRPSGENFFVPPPPLPLELPVPPEPLRLRPNLPIVQNRGPRSWIQRALVFIGYSGENAKERREIASLVFSLSFAFVQYAVVIALLVYSAHHESATIPGLSEWEACSRPLGVWDALWLIRTTCNCVLSVWSWQRSRALRRLVERAHGDDDAEAARLALFNAGSPTPGRQSASARPSQLRIPRAPGTLASGSHSLDSRPDHADELKYSQLYARLSISTSFISLAWFLTAHILEYTSVNTCRISSPHLWWLTFGILCILYLMVLEIFMLGVLVFFVGPLFYLFWNIVLLCLGRHSLGNPHYIKPEIGKLPKSTVDKIPLVLYIPPPPEASPKDAMFKNPAVPAPTYSYPPNRAAPAAQPRRRFAFLRRVAVRKGKNQEAGSSAAEEKSVQTKSGDRKKTTWEDNWEAGEYPFVRLEGNRAACAICLLDFEEPKRAGGGENDKVEQAAKEAGSVISERPAEASEGDTREAVEDHGVHEVQVGNVSEEEIDWLKLDDAEEGAQLLRLLGCGHVFHQTCVDPWLIDVSGRCPICQRPVEVDPPPKKTKKHGRTF